MEDKKFDNEMHGSLWVDDDRKNEKAPTATGTITISGVDLRIAMWPGRVAKVKGEDRKYWPISVEYKQGTKFVLAKVSPANIVVTGAAASSTSVKSEEAPGDGSNQSVEDLPF